MTPGTNLETINDKFDPPVHLCVNLEQIKKSEVFHLRRLTEPWTFTRDPQMRHIFHVLIGMFFCTELVFAQSLKDDYEQLQREYASSSKAWAARHDLIKTESDSISRYSEWPAWTFAPKFLAFAESAGASQEGFAAIMEILRMGQDAQFDQQMFDNYEHALELLLANHRDKELRPICSEVGQSKQSEVFLRTLIAEGDSTELRAEACFRLGKLLSQRRDLCLPASWTHTRNAPTGSFFEYRHAREKKHIDKLLAGENIELLQAEAIRCFELVISEYAGAPALRGDETLDTLARREIHEIKNLTIGVAAPEITGRDLDGRRMNLSDHRGKVVLLVFWASWCGPCIADIPYEKELHSRFASRPFVIVGVNADKTLEAARESVKENSVPWRSFRNQSTHSKESISTDWNVYSWPTVYVLDHEGTICFKHLRREGLDEPLEQLVKAAEAFDADR